MLLVTVLTAVVTSMLAVVVNLATELKTNPWAWLGVVVLTAICAAISLNAHGLSLKIPASGAEVDEMLTELIRSSKNFWSRALRHRGLRSDQLIEVPWSAYPAVPDRASDGLNKRGLRQQIVGKLRARETSQEDIREVARVFLQERARILIIGPAGAGKSSLARQIASACINLRDENDPVPVIISVSSWRTGEPVSLWIERQLIEAHQFLARRTVGGTSIARELVEASRVFPVFDGLDELPESPRMSLIEAIRDSIAENSPLLVTYRTAEGTDPVEAGRGLPLDTVLVMEPVSLEKVKKILLEDATSQQRGRWTSLMETCRSDPAGSLAQALSRPLMVAMADEVYRDDGRDPSELLDSERFSNREVIEDHLFSSYIPTMVRRKGHIPDVAGQRYQEDALLRWMSFLAIHLDRLDTYDFRWWDLRKAIPARNVVVAFSLLGGLIATLAALATIPQIGLIRCVAAGVGFGFLIWLELDLRPPRLPQRMTPNVSSSTRNWFRGYRHRARKEVLSRFFLGAGAGGAVVVLMAILLWATFAVAPEFARQALAGGGIFPDITDRTSLLGLSIGMPLLFGVLFVVLLAFDPETDSGKKLAWSSYLATVKNENVGIPYEFQKLTAHQSVEFEAASNPRGTLKQDRRWSLLYLAAVVLWWPLIVLVSTPRSQSAMQNFPLFAWINENAIWAAVITALVAAPQVFVRAEWPWFIVVRVPLTLARAIPVRLITFLDDMDTWDVLRREGDVYRFRHATLRDWLLRCEAKKRYSSLGAEQRRILSRMRLHPGPDFTADMVAHIAAISPAQVQRYLDEFCKAEILTRAKDHYRWRPGCCAAVNELAAADEPPGLRDRVADRIRCFYRDLFFSFTPYPPSSALHEPYRPMAMSPDGWRRLRADHHNVIACIRQAVKDGDIGYVVEMSLLLVPYLQGWGLNTEARDMLEDILVTAAPLSESAEMKLLYELAKAQWDNPETAKNSLDKVLQLAREVSDRGYEVLALCQLAYLRETHDPDDALETAMSAYQLASDTDRPDSEAAALHCLGTLRLALAPGEAQKMFLDSRIAAQRSDCRLREADSVRGIGLSLLSQNDPDSTVTYLTSARDLYKDAGDTVNEANVSWDLANLLYSGGQLTKALPFVMSVIRYAHKASDELTKARAHWLQGEIYRRKGELASAAYVHALARQLFAKCGDRQGEAAVLLCMGCMFVNVAQIHIHERRDGEWALTEGRSHLNAALQAFVELGDRCCEADTLYELGRAATLARDVVLAEGLLSHAISRYEALDDSTLHERIEEVRVALECLERRDEMTGRSCESESQ